MSSVIKEEELGNLIEKLTTTGKRTLDEGLMKTIKSICKSSDACVKYAYNVLMNRLRKEHSEIRFSALQIINELFYKSSAFRLLLQPNLKEFFELVVETNPSKPLPKPLPAAKLLKRTALECIQNWNTKYGQRYRHLKIGFQYLKNCLKIDFNDLEARNAAQREQQRLEEERAAKVVQEKILKVKNEMQELTSDISSVVTQMENCFRLLIPHPEDFFSSLDFTPQSNCDAQPTSISKKGSLHNEDTDFDFHESLRQHGFHNMKKSIVVEVENKIDSEVAVDANEDNLPVIENLQDLFRQVSSIYLPAVTRWLKILAKGTNCTDTIKQAIDLKRMLEGSLIKYKELKIKPCNLKTGDDDEDDDDFVEVKEKDGYEDSVKIEPATSNQSFAEPTCSKYVSDTENALQWKFKHCEEDLKDPTSASSTLNKRTQNTRKKSSELNCATVSSIEEVQTSKHELLGKAPILPYDIDLYHWEDEKPVVPEKIRFDSLHKFWETKDDDNEEQAEALREAQIASLRTRKIDFSGKFEPVKWSCRAPLPSGKLCPRKDRYKCPFHGKIIKRDELGNPVDVSELKSECSSQSTSTNVTPDWQDPELLKDIEAATGINLKIPEKKGKGKRKKTDKKDGLTKISNIPAPPKERMMNKIMKRYKHYAPKLDEMERKRFNDKFGDQWNYY